MKKLFIALTLLLSTAGFAKIDTSVFPYVTNMMTSVQIQIWNNGARMVNCSGPVNMYLQSGRSETQYINEIVWPHQTAFRTVRPLNSSDRVRSVSHGIFCF